MSESTDTERAPTQPFVEDARVHLAQTIVALRATFAAFEAAYRVVAYAELKLPRMLDVPDRVPSYIDGPRAGKGAKHVTGTIKNEEFAQAHVMYLRRGGHQPISELLRDGFSVQELTSLLGYEPTSWIEDKLEEVQIDQGQAGGEKLLQGNLEDAPNAATGVVDKPAGVECVEEVQ